MAKPFLKWAGGKTQLLGEIQKHINFNKTDSFLFVEPFVGSGAVLFWMLNNFPDIKKAVINDVNADLVNCYKVVKNDVIKLIALLHEFEKEYHALSSEPEKSKLYYYEKRKLFNTRTSGILEQSALLIFLNRTCFNGLFRVNKKNKFNVPLGSYIRPQICNAANLLAVSELLQKVEILNGDFADTIKYASRNSLFYFDPPYKPLSVTSNFNSYAQGDFDDKEQIRLKEFCDQLDELNCKWILSNSDVKGENLNDNFFDDLFKTYRIDRVLARRSINSNAGKRGKLTELLITNNVKHVNAT